MEIIIAHIKEENALTLGLGIIFNHENEEMFSFRTLELPFKSNIREISRIPIGKYKVTKRTSVKYGKHLKIEDVKGRNMILMHAGNYASETKGCILVGKSIWYDPHKGESFIRDSKTTLANIYSLVDDTTTLTIL